MAGYGMKGHVMIDLQNSFGTSSVTSLTAIPVIDESLNFTLNTLQSANNYARFAQSPTYEGATKVEGSINMEADPQAVGWLMCPFCEAYSNTGFAHTFKLANTDFCDKSAGTPFTAEVYRDVGSAHLYFDLVGNTLVFNISNGELMTTNLDVIGAGYARKAKSTPIYTTGDKLFRWDQASCQFDNADLTDLRDVTITINKNLDTFYTLVNTNSPRKIKRTDAEIIEISGTILFQSHSYQIAFEEQSEKSMILNFMSNSPNNIKFDFPAVKIKDYSVSMSGKGIIEASFTADALYSTTSATAMEITLTNVRTVAYG